MSETRLPVEVKDSKMIELLGNGASMSEAMESVGYAPNTIAKCSGRVAARLRDKLCAEMDKQGLSASNLIAKLAYGMENSSKPIVIDGNIVDYPDHNTRLSYIREILKIADAYPSDKLEISAETYEERIMRLHSQGND